MTSETIEQTNGYKVQISFINLQIIADIVELDDTYLGAPIHGKKRGRGTEKVKIIVALSKSGAGHPMYLKMSDVPNLKGITVGKFASKNIHEGAKIESDNAQSDYFALRKAPFRFTESTGAQRGKRLNMASPCMNTNFSAASPSDTVRLAPVR